MFWCFSVRISWLVFEWAVENFKVSYKLLYWSTNLFIYQVKLHKQGKPQSFLLGNWQSHFWVLASKANEDNLIVRGLNLLAQNNYDLFWAELYLSKFAVLFCFIIHFLSAVAQSHFNLIMFCACVIFWGCFSYFWKYCNGYNYYFYTQHSAVTKWKENCCFEKPLFNHCSTTVVILKKQRIKKMIESSFWRKEHNFCSPVHVL